MTKRTWSRPGTEGQIHEWGGSTETEAYYAQLIAERIAKNAPDNLAMFCVEVNIRCAIVAQTSSEMEKESPNA